MEVTEPYVSADWLNQHLTNPNLIILNATLPKVGNVESQPVLDSIPGAREFDFEDSFRDTEDPRPNTMPSPEKFTLEARNLGINHRSTIIVYDEHGIYSSPRAWWMFRSMGHKKVAVLNGGLPYWLDKGFPVEPKSKYQGEKGNFFASFDKKYFVTARDIVDSLDGNQKLILDARSPGRFSGVDKEPREGMRSGHIPGAQNMHYSSILNGTQLLPPDQISSLFQDLADSELICSCGSGITACILALNAEIAGIQSISIYDGSWSEWGIDPSLPIES